MRWLVTGGKGQLGHALARELALRGEPFRAPGREELDVTDEGALGRALADGPGGPPEIVVNAAGATHVDRCEREPAWAGLLNARAPARLAELCAERGIRLVHLSTDYVFPGNSRRPYREDDETGPRSVYGRTKLEGELAVRGCSPDFLVIRTSWVFGHGRNFIANVLAQAAAGRPLRVVADQRGRPTAAADLARGLLQLVEREGCGLYHLANGGEATWWDVARAALDLGGFRDAPVQRIRTDEIDVAAPRPHNSVLDCGKAAAAGVELPPWREGLARYLASEDAPPRGR